MFDIVFFGEVGGALLLVQLFYWAVIYARPLQKAAKAAKTTKQPEKTTPCPPVSIVVYAKNESENLLKHLPSLLTQDYPTYEVIVVNDGSTDESESVLKQLKREYNHLYYTFIPEEAKYVSRKKLALTVGIKAAKHDILLFTEADCRPISNQWVASIAQAYTSDTEIVLGFCAYRHAKGFLHQLIAYDNLINGLQYLSSALVRRPFTGSGRNLSYRKELFFRKKGFYKSLALHAGDDDLFINESATKKNTRTVYFPESITETLPVKRFRTWREMKVSRAATQRRYKGGRLILFRLEELTYFLLLGLAIAATRVGWLSGDWILVAVAGSFFLVRFIVKAVILHKSAKRLQQKPVTSLLFLMEFIRPLFNIYVGIYRAFRGKNDYTARLKSRIR